MALLNGMTRTLVALGAVGEAATGVVLIVAPGGFVTLLLGAELSGAGIALGRLTGFALLALGVGCWPDARPASGQVAALRALLTYGLLATIYLFGLGLAGTLVGRLLWPAVVVHAVYTFLLGRAWLGRSPDHSDPRPRPSFPSAR